MPSHKQPILHYPNPDKRYIVYTDASDDACGAQLCQEHQGTEFPIAFLSHTFTETQRKWSTTEQEAYGIYYAITKWNYYLQGADILVKNDHKPLARFLNGKNANNKVNRWSLELATYNITFEWISGAKNKAADCLSHLVQPLTSNVHMLTATHSDGPAFNTRSHSSPTQTPQALQHFLQSPQQPQNHYPQIDLKPYYKCKKRTLFANEYPRDYSMARHRTTNSIPSHTSKAYFINTSQMPARNF